MKFNITSPNQSWTPGFCPTQYIDHCKKPQILQNNHTQFIWLSNSHTWTSPTDRLMNANYCSTATVLHIWGTFRWQRFRTTTKLIDTGLARWSLSAMLFDYLVFVYFAPCLRLSFHLAASVHGHMPHTLSLATIIVDTNDHCNRASSVSHSIIIRQPLALLIIMLMKSRTPSVQVNTLDVCSMHTTNNNGKKNVS